jgi:hypothetical protein
MLPDTSWLLAAVGVYKGARQTRRVYHGHNVPPMARDAHSSRLVHVGYGCCATQVTSAAFPFFPPLSTPLRFPELTRWRSASVERRAQDTVAFGRQLEAEESLDPRYPRVGGFHKSAAVGAGRGHFTQGTKADHAGTGSAFTPAYPEARHFGSAGA